MFGTKEISRICRTSTKQLKIYNNLNLFDSPIYENGKIALNESNLKRLFVVKSLQEFGLTIKQTKILIDNNITDEAVEKMMKHFVSKQIDNYFLFQKAIQENWHEKSFKEKNDFIIFSHNQQIDCVVYEFYALYKEWLKDDMTKIILKKNRSEMFKTMKNFTYEESDKFFEKASIYFKYFYNFFVEKGLTESYLYFISYMRWLTMADKFKRQMTSLACGSYSIDLYELALKWVALDSNIQL